MSTKPRSEDHLEDALCRAIDATAETGDASEAVAKVASDMSLSPGEIEFVATAYNNAKSFALGSNLDEESRSADFDLADPGKVISKVYPESVKTASEETEYTDTSYEGTTVSLPSLDSVADAAPLLKTASEKFKESFTSYQPDISQYDRNILVRRIRNLHTTLPSTHQAVCRALQKTASQNEERMKQWIHKAADEFIRYPDSKKEKVARRIVNGFGEDLGGLALEAISIISGKKMPEVVKTASHSIFPPDRIYRYLANMQDSAVKSRKARGLAEQLRKTAAITGDLAEAVTGGTLGTDPMSELLREGLGRKDRDKTLEEELPADLFIKLKGLKSREAFMKAILSSPHLQEFSLDALQDAFNYAMETNPELVDSPRALSNVMLHNINTQNIDDLYALKSKQEMAAGDIKKKKEKEELTGKKQEREKKEEEKKKTEKEASRRQYPSSKIRGKAEGFPEKVIQGVLEGGKEDLHKRKDKKEKKEGARKKEQEQKDRESDVEKKTKLQALHALRNVAPIQAGQKVWPKKGVSPKVRRGWESLAIELGGTPSGSGPTQELDSNTLARLHIARAEGGLTPEGEALYDTLVGAARELGGKPMDPGEMGKAVKRHSAQAMYDLSVPKQRMVIPTSLKSIREAFKETS